MPKINLKTEEEEVIVPTMYIIKLFLDIHV